MNATKQALAAVGAIPAIVLEKRPMFARLKSFVLWTLFYTIVTGGVFAAGYLFGVVNTWDVSRQVHTSEGIQAGINCALNDAQARGYGVWIAEPTNGSASPRPRFLWRDEAESILQGRQSNPFQFDPTAPRESGPIQIGEPDKDRSTSNAPARVTLCGVVTSAGGAARAATASHEQQARRPIIPLLETDQDREKGITTLANPADPCDPWNFVYFMGFLLLVALSTAGLATFVSWIHRRRRASLAVVRSTKFEY